VFLDRKADPPLLAVATAQGTVIVYRADGSVAGRFVGSARIVEALAADLDLDGDAELLLAAADGTVTALRIASP
jgi:hypothetical protein